MNRVRWAAVARRPVRDEHQTLTLPTMLQSSNHTKCRSFHGNSVKNLACVCILIFYVVYFNSFKLSGVSFLCSSYALSTLKCLYWNEIDRPVNLLIKFAPFASSAFLILVFYYYYSYFIFLKWCNEEVVQFYSLPLDDANDSGRMEQIRGRRTRCLAQSDESLLRALRMRGRAGISCVVRCVRWRS